MVQSWNAFPQKGGGIDFAEEATRFEGCGCADFAHLGEQRVSWRTAG